VNGDLILLGPPIVITDDELVRLADGLSEAITSAVAGIEASAR
jgi:hypothetical protein